MKDLKLITALICLAAVAHVLERVTATLQEKSDARGCLPAESELLALPPPITEDPQADAFNTPCLVTVDWRYNDVNETQFILEDLTETSMLVRRIDSDGKPLSARTYSVNLKRVLRLSIGALEFGRMDYALEPMAADGGGDGEA